MATFYEAHRAAGTLRLVDPAEEYAVTVVDPWATEDHGYVEWGGRLRLDTTSGIEMRMGDTAELMIEAGVGRIVLTDCVVGGHEVGFVGIGPVLGELVSG